MLKFNKEEADEMKRIETDISRHLLPMRGRVEAALVAFALVRCARVLLSLYPDETRQVLAALCGDYIEQRRTTQQTTGRDFLLQ